MTGLKYKLAHKRAEKENWNITDNAQRNRLIEILQELISPDVKKPIIVYQKIRIIKNLNSNILPFFS
jgi:hypothetical protein